MLIRPTILKSPEEAALIVSQERQRLPGIREAEAEFKADERARQLKVEKKLLENTDEGPALNRQTRSKPPFN